MSAILRRSAWHPDPRKGFSRALVPSQVTGIVVHYPGDGAVTRAGLSQERVAALLRGYRRYHITHRGWPDIGYCYAIDQAGRIWEAAGLRIAAHSATAADPNANRTNIGILFVVGNSEAPTPEALTAFQSLRRDLLRQFPRATRLRGHRHVTGASTACPGNALARLIETGTLTTPPKEDQPDMDATQARQLDELHDRVTRYVDAGLSDVLKRVGTIEERVTRYVDARTSDVLKVAGAVVNGDPQQVAAAVADLLRDDLVAAVQTAAPGADPDAILDALHTRLEN